MYLITPFYEGIRLMVMIPGMPVPFMFLSAELTRRFSFQYQGSLFFNSLSADIVRSVNVSTFKKNLKKHLLTSLVPFPPPPSSSSFSLSALSFAFFVLIPYSFVLLLLCRCRSVQLTLNLFLVI